MTPAERRRAIVAASRARRRRRKPPPAQPPDAIAREYERALRARQAGFWRVVWDVVRPHLADLRDLSPLRQDGPAELLIGRIINDIVVAYGVRFPDAELGQLAFDFARKISDYNRRQLNEQFRAVIGIDLPASDTHLGEALDLFRTQNVDLITRMTQDQLGRIETLLTQHARSGSRVEQIRRELQEQQSLGRARAELIARDQVLKLNGQLTQLRQKEAGVEEYEWNTSGDERVREFHRRLNGTVHRWDNPPVTDKKGRRNHPGEDFQCRCVAIPIINL